MKTTIILVCLLFLAMLIRKALQKTVKVDSSPKILTQPSLPTVKQREYSIEVYREAFNSVAGPIKIDAAIKSKLFDAFHETFCRGRDLHSITNAYKSLLNDVTWTWPAYDAMLEKCLKTNIWPDTWGRGDFPQQRMGLLIHTLSNAIATHQTIYDFNKNYDENSVFQCLDIMDNRAGCPIESEYIARFKAGELEGYPPFFPGDRTSLCVKFKDLD